MKTSLGIERVVKTRADRSRSTSSGVDGGPKADVLAAIAEAYVMFLSGIRWEHHLVVRGAREGLNKFVSNAYLASFTGRRKHELTQLISVAAYDRLQAGNSKDLVFEHLVPKQRVFQEPCERMARERKLTEEYVLGLLRRYWVAATVTGDEDKRLARRSMPQDWDRLDVMARYSAAGVGLFLNPFAAPGVPVCPAAALAGLIADR